MLRSTVIAVLIAASAGPCVAQTQATEKGRDIPGYFLPVPDDVSPQMRALVAAPPAPWDIHPKDIAEWKALVTRIANNAKAILPGMRQKLGVSIEPTTIGGVGAFILTPQTVAPENQNRVFLHFHGGAYVLNPGEAGTREGMLMAAFGRAKVISVDYRTSSDAPYPAALDDCVAVYRELLKTTPPQRIAVFGTSTGGGLSMALVLRAKQDGFAVPAAIAPGSPWADLTKTGDTFYTNNLVDNFQVSYDGYLKDLAYLYAGGRDLKDPMLSPIYGDLHGFPADDSDLRHSRPVPQFDGTHPSQAATVGRRGRASGLRSRIPCSTYDEPGCAGDARSIRGNRSLLRLSHAALSSADMG